MATVMQTSLQDSTVLFPQSAQISLSGKWLQWRAGFGLILDLGLEIRIYDCVFIIGFEGKKILEKIISLKEQIWGLY